MLCRCVDCTGSNWFSNVLREGPLRVIIWIKNDLNFGFNVRYDDNKYDLDSYTWNLEQYKHNMLCKVLY